MHPDPHWGPRRLPLHTAVFVARIGADELLFVRINAQDWVPRPQEPSADVVDVTELGVTVTGADSLRGLWRCPAGCNRPPSTTCRPSGHSPDAHRQSTPRPGCGWTSLSSAAQTSGRPGSRDPPAHPVQLPDPDRPPSLPYDRHRADATVPPQAPTERPTRRSRASPWTAPPQPPGPPRPHHYGPTHEPQHPTTTGAAAPRAPATNSRSDALLLRQRSPRSPHNKQIRQTTESVTYFLACLCRESATARSCCGRSGRSRWRGRLCDPEPEHPVTIDPVASLRLLIQGRQACED